MFDFDLIRIDRWQPELFNIVDEMTAVIIPVLNSSL